MNAADGLLPRFLLFNITGPKPAEIEPARDVFSVSKHLIDACQALSLAGGVGNLSRGVNNGGSPCTQVVVTYSPEAATELKAFKTFVQEQESNVEPKSLPILNRAVEHAIKLALTVSVATNHRKPVITGEQMAWATKLAWLSTATMIEETRDRISDNQREADWNRLLSHIKATGTDGISGSVLADRCRSIDKKRREELLSDMTNAGRVELREMPTKGRPRVRYIFVR